MWHGPSAGGMEAPPSLGSGLDDPSFSPAAEPSSVNICNRAVPVMNKKEICILGTNEDVDE